MLINLWGIVKGNSIIFDTIPFLILNDNLVGVKEVLIEWRSPRTNFIGMITTSLISKSAQNLHQEIIMIPQEYSGRFLFYSPTHISYYKSQLTQLNNSVFKIDTLEKEIPAIKKIYLQLNIIDAGIQQSTQQ